MFRRGDKALPGGFELQLDGQQRPCAETRPPQSHGGIIQPARGGRDIHTLLHHRIARILPQRLVNELAEIAWRSLALGRIHFLDMQHVSEIEMKRTRKVRAKTRGRDARQRH